MNFLNGKILLVDLKEKKTKEEYIDGNFLDEMKKAEDIPALLLKRYGGGNPIIIGTGILTASFFPASSGGFVAWERNGKGISTLPLNWFFPQEFKLSGFDFLIIKNSSEEPVRLWIRDGMCDILSAKDIMNKDLWETKDFLIEDHGDENIHVLLIGNGEPPALSQDYWGGFDSIGAGVEFKRKNLKAISVRGMGSLPLSDEVFRKHRELLKEIKEKLMERELFKKLYPKELEEKVHRPSSCFNCSLNCYPFFMVRESPAILKESEEKEPGFLALDPSYLKEKNLEKAEEMLRKGVHPDGLKEENLPPSWISFIKSISGEKDLEKIIGISLKSGICALFIIAIFDGKTEKIEEFLNYV